MVRCFFLLIIIVSHNALATDLGTISQTFPIKEEGFTKMITRKLETVDMEEERKKMEKIARDRIENPTPVEDISLAEENRVFYFDPTYTLKEDIILPCGKILYTAGTKVNYLDNNNLDRRMIFIDSRQKSQVEWLKETLSKDISSYADNTTNQNKIEDRVILVGGSVLKLKEDMKNLEIYFDQFGELVKKFGIKAVPAIALQEGRLLKIEEIKIN